MDDGHTGSYDVLTETEVWLIQELSIEYPSKVDISAVDQLLKEYIQHSEGEWNNESIHERSIARSLYIIRKNINHIEDVDDVLFKLLVFDLSILSRGVGIIRDLGDLWRIEPYFQAISGFSGEKATAGFEHFVNFEKTDYCPAAQQHRHRFTQYHRQLGQKNRHGLTDIPDLVRMIELSLPIFETQFPNLLAMKLILDGKSPDIDTIYRKSLVSIYRELTNTSDNPNSAYFNLIADVYGESLRNELAHGDLLYDASKECVRVPTTGREYTFDKLKSKWDRVYAIVVFLAGVMRSAVEIQYYIHRYRLDSDLVSLAQID
jgi:hypothetical protein